MDISKFSAENSENQTTFRQR